MLTTITEEKKYASIDIGKGDAMRLIVLVVLVLAGVICLIEVMERYKLEHPQLQDGRTPRALA